MIFDYNPRRAFKYYAITLSVALIMLTHRLLKFHILPQESLDVIQSYIFDHIKRMISKPSYFSFHNNLLVVAMIPDNYDYIKRLHYVWIPHPEKKKMSLFYVCALCENLRFRKSGMGKSPSPFFCCVLLRHFQSTGRPGEFMSVY